MWDSYLVTKRLDSNETKRRHKNLDFGCIFLLSSSSWSTIIAVMLCHAKSLQLCPTLCNPVDFSLPDSSVHGIRQARILKSVATSSSRDLPDPRIEPASFKSSALSGGFFNTSATWEIIAVIYKVYFFHSDPRYLWLERRLSVKELMVLNCGIGEDSRESLGLKGDQTSPS